MADPGIRLTDLPDIGAFTDASFVAGHRTGVGKFGAAALRTYFGTTTVTAAVGDNATDDTAAIQAVVTAVAAAGGGIVRLRRGIYKITSAITVPLNGKVYLEGEGMSATVIRQHTPGADGVVFTRDSYTVTGGGVMDLTIEAGAGFEASGFFGTGSTGTGLKVTRGNDNFITRGLGINNFAYGLALWGCWNTRHSDLKVLFSQNNAVVVGKSGVITAGGNSLTGAKLSNNGFSGDNSASFGIRILASGGDYWNTIDCTSFQIAVTLVPGVGDQVLYQFFNTVLSDTSEGDAWYINGSAGNVYSVACSNCWASYSSGDGVVVTGANVRDFQWNGSRSRENVGVGIRLEGGGFFATGGSVMHNSRTADNTQPGVKVLAGVSDWGLTGVRIGNDGQSAAVQAEGIVIDAGASDRFHVVGCDLTSPGAGKASIANGSSGGGFIVANNLPVATAGTNPQGAIFLAGSTLAAVAAGATAYLGANGGQASEVTTNWRAPRSAVITGLTVAVVAAPGVGETFTYTVMANGIATPLSGTMTGAGIGAGVNTLSVSAPAVVLPAFTTTSVRVQTSAGAAVTQHAYSLRLE